MIKLKYHLVVLAIILFSISHGFARGIPASKSSPICDELYRTGQYETSLNCYQNALAKDPSNSALNLKMCLVLEALGKIEQIQPYLGKIDSSSEESKSFLEMINAEYGTLTLRCTGQSKCPIYFVARPALNFIAPSELELGRARRLSIINNKYSNRSNIWFRKTGKDKFIASIDHFPVVLSAPLPYSVDISGNKLEFNYNFLERGELVLSTSDIDSIACSVPDSVAELQMVVDDPDYEAVISKTAVGATPIEPMEGKYYFNNGDMPALAIQKADRTISGHKYFIISSLILTSAFILLQR